MVTRSSRGCSHNDTAKYRLIETVAHTIERYEMAKPGETILVAVSGGADSIALLHILNNLRARLKINLAVAHLNHCIRGAESDEDQQFVEEVSKSLGILIKIGVADVLAISKKEKIGLEEAARRARYDFLNKTADELGTEHIAVAHTADDQAETVLMNIIRGCGIDGLRGMVPVRGKIIRPLLEVSRNDIIAYLTEEKLRWREDKTNKDVDYTRNRVRHELIPIIEKELNPRFKENILALSKIAAEEADYIFNQSLEMLRECVINESIQRIEIDAERLRDIPRALARRCLRIAIERVRGNLTDIETSHIEDVLNALNDRREFHSTMPGAKVHIDVKNGKTSIYSEIEIEKFDFEIELQVPGITHIPEIKCKIECDMIENRQKSASFDEVVLDADRILGKLKVRTWRYGDKIDPVGLTGTKKLQDIFTDKKVTKEERYRKLIVVDDEKILWVASTALSRTVYPTENTKRLIKLRILPDETV